MAKGKKKSTAFDDTIHMRCYKTDKEAFNERCNTLLKRDPGDVLREIIHEFGKGRVSIRRPDSDDIAKATQELYQ